MQKDYNKIKENIRERIKAKEEYLAKISKEKQEKEEKEKEIKQLISMEQAINESIERNKDKNKILDKLIDYYNKDPAVATIQGVFCVGAVIMLLQKEWLPFLFCLAFPLFVPKLMKKVKK